MLVPLSAEETQRIEKQAWTKADGVDPSAMIQSSLGQARLGHQADGACVFLDSAGRCRIHLKFGEAAKPLACRLYPLVFHPTGKKFVVGLRFSCPSAVADRGRPMIELGTDILKLAQQVLPEDYEEILPPPVLAEPVAEWPDLLRFTHWLDQTLAPADIPVALKLLRALHWLSAVERGCLDQITGESADEILEALVQSSAKKLPALPRETKKPTRFGRLILRLLVLEHARTVTVADTDVRSGQHWKMFIAAMKFFPSNGSTPALRPELGRVGFAKIENNFGPLSANAEQLLTRYFRVKIQSLHFCGKGFYDRPLIEGFRNLALVYPITIWLTRWLAVSAGRTSVADADVMRAISLVDCHFGFSPYLSWRTRLLQQRDDIVRLCQSYAQ